MYMKALRVTYPTTKDLNRKEVTLILSSTKYIDQTWNDKEELQKRGKQKSHWNKLFD